MARAQIRLSSLCVAVTVVTFTTSVAAQSCHGVPDDQTCAIVFNSTDCAFIEVRQGCPALCNACPPACFGQTDPSVCGEIFPDSCAFDSVRNTCRAMCENCGTAPPTHQPTVEPSISPTDQPSTEPTATPTDVPSLSPTAIPTDVPTSGPTAVPTLTPTATPTDAPTAAPTAGPTVPPTGAPSSLAPTASEQQSQSDSDDDSTRLSDTMVIIVAIIGVVGALLILLLVLGIRKVSIEHNAREAEKNHYEDEYPPGAKAAATPTTRTIQVVNAPPPQLQSLPAQYPPVRAIQYNPGADGNTSFYANPFYGKQDPYGRQPRAVYFDGYAYDDELDYNA